MLDLKQKILGVIGKPFLASFATVTGEGKPWVRYVVAAANEDLTITFATFTEARKVQQIKANSAVHITGGVDGLSAEPAPYVQVEGTAEFTRDEQKRHAFWNNMFSKYFEGPDDPNYALIEVTPNRIELWGANPDMPHEAEVWEA